MRMTWGIAFNGIMECYEEWFGDFMRNSKGGWYEDRVISYDRAPQKTQEPHWPEISDQLRWISLPFPPSLSFYHLTFSTSLSFSHLSHLSHVLPLPHLCSRISTPLPTHFKPVLQPTNGRLIRTNIDFDHNKVGQTFINHLVWILAFERKQIYRSKHLMERLKPLYVRVQDFCKSI